MVVSPEATAEASRTVSVPLMSDLQLLFLVLALLYGWECACWINRGSVAFRSWWVRETGSKGKKSHPTQAPTKERLLPPPLEKRGSPQAELL